MAYDGLNKYMDAVAEIGRNPVSKHQPIRFSLSIENERAGAGRDGRTRLARPNSQGTNGDREIIHFFYSA